MNFDMAQVACPSRLGCEVSTGGIPQRCKNLDRDARHDGQLMDNARLRLVCSEGDASKQLY
jgi:hypothetical protein